MDLSKHLDEIVKNIVTDIQTKVGDQVSNTVKAELKKQLDSLDLNETINALASEKLNQRISEIQIDDSAVQKRVNSATSTIINTIQAQTEQSISQLVEEKVASQDFSKSLTNAMTTVLANRIKEIHFPENSIPAASVNQSDLRITGDQIVGGIITNFGSTGIDDRATACVMTILDTAVVVENNLVTMDLTVQGNLDVKGTVPDTSPFFTQLTSAVTKSVHAGLNTELFSGFSTTIFDKIKTEGLDLSKITVNEQVVIDDNRIGFNITDSNLQKLGLLRELQVSGESFLDETLYVSNKRVGVNTMEPSAALAIWDEDIEITVSKFKDGTGKISTPRNQSLILGSNKHNNIIMGADGQTQIDNLKIGDMRFGSSETPPSFSSTKGHIVFNANPSVGGPLGWVCLGAANWANFGIID